ncbi:MAG: hypothetical protein V4760_16670, partial [Bdellovibrionota bacterium]
MQNHIDMWSVNARTQTHRSPSSIGSISRSKAALIFALLFSVVTLLAEPAFAQLLERVEAAAPEVEDNARSILADVDANAKVDLDLTIFDELEAGLGYTYNVQPTFQGDQYTRIDRWRPRLELRFPGLFTKIQSKAEIVFLRQFPSQWDALKAVPTFEPNKIPLSTANALRLEPGEVVMLPLELNLLIGRGASATAAPLALYFEGHYVMKGRFQIQVLRMAEKRVRLRLVAIRSNGTEIEGGARLSFDVFNLSVLGNAFEGILGRKVGSVGFSKGARAVVMADYVFDLNDPAAANAYDRLLAADQKIAKLKLVNPFVGESDLQRSMISDLTEVDRIATADSAKPVETRRIWSVFKGRSQGTTEIRKRELNVLKLFTLRRSSSVSNDNHIVFMDTDNEEVDFFAPTSVRTTSQRYLFGLSSESFQRKASVIVPADTDGKPNGMGEYVVSVEMKDKRMGKSETTKALKFFRRSISGRILSTMGFESLLNRTSYKHARVYVQAIFNQEAMVRLEGFDRATLATALDHYLLTIRDELPGNDERAHADWLRDRRKDIRESLDGLATAFSPWTPVKDRIRVFITLQKNKFFR